MNSIKQVLAVALISVCWVASILILCAGTYTIKINSPISISKAGSYKPDVAVMEVE